MDKPSRKTMRFQKIYVTRNMKRQKKDKEKWSCFWVRPLGHIWPDGPFPRDTYHVDCLVCPYGRKYIGGYN